MNKPFIVVVTGRPGSGKTTLAHHLSLQIHCPALCRDEFKEGLVHSLGSNHDSLGNDINRQLYEIFFDTVQFLSTRSISLVIEAAFQHQLWEPKLHSLIALANLAIIVCSVDPFLARSRIIQRGLADPTRIRFHGDSEVYRTDNEYDLSNTPIKQYIAPKLNVPTLTVDTTEGYKPSIDYIVSFINGKITNQ